MSDLTASQARAVFASAPDGILIVDEEGVIRQANSQIAEQFGYEAEELVGQEVEVLVPDRVRDLHVSERREYTGDPRARPMGVGLELFGRRKDGSEFPVEISLSPFHGEDDELRVIAIVRDVTERRRLREFGAGALRAAEEERRRIARELHDDTAQRLATLMIRLRLLERSADEDRRGEILREMREEVLACSESVRRIARGLRPPELEELGVTAAIRSHARGLTENLDLDVQIEAEGAVDTLSEEARLALYRILQEALSNVVRHAEAETVVVRLGSRDGRVTAEVEDDGVGFDVDRVGPGRGGRLGLVGMEERASLVGGSVEVDSEPGEGTRVRVQIPADGSHGGDGGDGAGNGTGAGAGSGPDRREAS